VESVFVSDDEVAERKHFAKRGNGCLIRKRQRDGKLCT
jgi:hypothetical protein